jgi:hypothetical protein
MRWASCLVEGALKEWPGAQAADLGAAIGHLASIKH